jgi:hypothetical protein
MTRIEVIDTTPPTISATLNYYMSLKKKHEYGCFIYGGIID